MTTTPNWLTLVGTDSNRSYAWELKPGTYTVGRQPECDFSVQDKTVSRSHARILVSPTGEVLVEDVGSHNGTTVNGNKVTAPLVVKSGDQISFGATDFRFSNGQPAAASTPKLTERDLEKSVVLSLAEALKPLPSKVTDIPELYPVMSEMARLLVASEPRDEMLTTALALIARVIPADRLAVLLTVPGKEEVEPAAIHLRSGESGQEFQLSRTIVREILANRSAILIADPRSDARFAAQESIVALSLRSAMAVPLFEQERVLGILYADTTNPLHHYTEDFLRLFATFGNVLASRLLNYALIDEREQRRVIESEMRRASGIQKRLLISRAPEVPGYQIVPYQQQCLTVGGDLYDVAVLPDGRVVLVLGDVSGKGLGAALLMSNILASLRTLYYTSGYELHHALQQTSNQLYAFSDPADFATMFIGLLDPKSHLLTFVNAGHNPPYYMANDGTVRQLDAGGTMIGIMPGGMWRVDQVSLQPGDLIIVYSDGVTEAMHGNEQFGEVRLLDLLARTQQQDAQRVVDSLCKELAGFVGDYPRSDDVTLLTLKRNSLPS